MEKQMSDELITEAPLTTDAREVLLREQFVSDFPHDGKLFVPDDLFYINGPPHKQANTMRDALCGWLGINRRHIGLVFEGDKNDVNDSSNYRIFIETSSLRNEFVLGASIAHALVRYLIEDKKHIRLNERDQQDALIATAGILFGLGIVISNGLLPRHGWLEALGIHKQVHHELLGNTQTGQYHQQLRAYIKRYRIPTIHFSAACTPWTERRLNVKTPMRTSHAVRVAKHNIHITRLKLVGSTFLALMVVMLAGIIGMQRALPLDSQTQAAQERATFLKTLTQACRDKLAYEKQYTDTSDLLSQRTIDAQENRCTSLNNQYRSALFEYENKQNN